MLADYKKHKAEANKVLDEKNCYIEYLKNYFDKLNNKFDKKVDGIVDKNENVVKVTYMTEINTLKDEIKMRKIKMRKVKMRNKMLDDNKMYINYLKHSLHNQNEMKEAYHKMDTDNKTAYHTKEKILHELRELQKECCITKKAIYYYYYLCIILNLKVKSLKGEKTTLESYLNELSCCQEGNVYDFKNYIELEFQSKLYKFKKNLKSYIEDYLNFSKELEFKLATISKDNDILTLGLRDVLQKMIFFNPSFNKEI